jgi:hypothetical protein
MASSLNDDAFKEAVSSLLNRFDRCKNLDALKIRCAWGWKSFSKNRKASSNIMRRQPILDFTNRQQI